MGIADALVSFSEYHHHLHYLLCLLEKNRFYLVFFQGFLTFLPKKSKFLQDFA